MMQVNGGSCCYLVTVRHWKLLVWMIFDLDIAADPLMHIAAVWRILKMRQSSGSCFWIASGYMGGVILFQVVRIWETDREI